MSSSSKNFCQSGLDRALKGIDIEEGYISSAQKRQFSKQLSSFPDIRTIAEIGFNAGHSAEFFYQKCKKLALFAAFDLNRHSYTKIALEYFYQTYPGRFVFIPGDSLQSVPEVGEKFPKIKFDLIYIDGCHEFEWAFGDICNARKIAHPNTTLWIDDVEPNLKNAVAQAVNCAETMGIIQVEKTFESNDPKEGKRYWVQAKIV